MKQNIIRKTCQIVPVLLITGALAACDAHIEEPDKTVRPGHVLCVDGKAVPYSEYESYGEQAIAVVFHTYSDGETEGNGYAVYLWDMTPKAFADSLGVEQGTSADITAYDGNENTNALHATDETTSPMAQSVFACGIRAERLCSLGGSDAPAVCGTWHYQSGHREMRWRPAADRGRRVLVLDIDGGGRTADGQSMALLDSQRSHAGNAQDAGA